MKLLRRVAASVALLCMLAGSAFAQYVGNVPGAGSFVYDNTSGNWYTMLGTTGAPGVAVANNEGTKRTFRVAGSFAPAAAATDVFTIRGSASTVVRVTHVDISCTATTAANYNVLLILRSTADTGGTSTGLVGQKADGNDVTAVGAAAVYYTVNPTGLGSTSGNVGGFQAYAANGGLLVNASWDFGLRNSKAQVLRGTNQNLAVNLNGATLAGGACIVSAEWTEE